MSLTGRSWPSARCAGEGEDMLGYAWAFGDGGGTSLQLLFPTHTVMLFYCVIPYTHHMSIPMRALAVPESPPPPFSISDSPVLLPDIDPLLSFCSHWNFDLWETLLPQWPATSTVPPSCRWYWFWSGGNHTIFLLSWVSLQQTTELPAPLMGGQPAASQSISFPSSVTTPSTHNPSECRAASQVWQKTIKWIKVSPPACMSIRKCFSLL